MSEQQCIRCTWDGVTLVKMCKHHAEIDRLQQRLAAAEAAARWCYKHSWGVWHKETALELWPWLEDQANGGKDE